MAYFWRQHSRYMSRNRLIDRFQAFSDRIAASPAMQVFERFPRLCLFVCLLLSMGLVGYTDIVNRPPESFHQWRQADCTSMATRYYQDGMDFFNPAMHYIFSGDGHAVGELPIVPYLTAAVWHVTGKHDRWYRLLVLSLWIAGLMAFFAMLRLLFDGWFWPAMLTLLFFASPLLAYYGLNFLADMPALSLTLVGWWLFVKHSKKGRQLDFWLAVAAFALAALLKLTAGISFLTVAGLWVLERLRWTGKQTLFHQRWMAPLALLGGMAVVFAWYQWAIAYNGKHQVLYFSTWTYPIWDMTGEQIGNVLSDVNILWRKAYYAIPTQYVGLLLLVGSLFFVRKGPGWLHWALWIILVGDSAFMTLQFSTFAQHDYYVINLMMVWAILFTLAVAIVKDRFPNVYRSAVLRLLMVGFVVVNLVHVQQQLKERYHSWPNAEPKTELLTVATELEAIGVAQDDRILSLPDQSPNISLYFLNRQGITGYGSLNADLIDACIEKQRLRWVVIRKPLDEATQQLVAPYLGELAGDVGGVKIYRIKQPKR